MSGRHNGYPTIEEVNKCGGQSIDDWAPHRAAGLMSSLGLFDGAVVHSNRVEGGPNCCLPGYTGRICEECIYPMLKIDGQWLIYNKLFNVEG